MFNTNLTLTVPSLLVMDGGTPRTPEILNSLMAMTSPLEYSYPVNTSQTSLNDSHSNSSDSPLDSPASQHHPHHQQQSHQQLYHHQTRKTPSVQQTRSQLIKEGVKLLIQNKRKHSGGDSSDGNESSTPLPKVSRRREPSGTDQRETSDDDMDSKSSPRSTVALTPEDEDRRRRRRERNKIAATKCRMKKRERTVNLINESETLDAQNKELKSQVSKLESERRKLLEVLQAHGPKCVHQKGYQPLPALSSITSSNRNLNDLGYLDPNAGAEQGAAEIKYSECLKTEDGGSALQSFAKQDPDGVLLPPGYCKLSPTEPNSFLLENATAELATTGETNGTGTGFLARGQKTAYAGVSVSSSSSSSTSSTTVNQTTGKSRAKPGPKPRQSRAQSSAAPKVTSTTVSATPVTTNATSLSSLPYVSKGGNPLMTASLMATTPSSSPASLPSPVTMSSSCSSVSVSNPILTLTAAAHDTDFMLKNELIDTSSPYTTVQSADRFLFDATLDLYNNNAHSPLTAGLNCGSTPQQQQQQQQNHHLAQNNVTLNNNNPNLVNENDRLNHLSAIKDNTSNTLLEFGVSFDALKPATVDYQQQQQQQQQHQATNDMNHHHHHHHPQQQLHGATMLGGDPTLSHLLHQQQQHQNHQQQQQHQHHQHQQHLLQQQHQLQLHQLQQQHQQHQQQLVSNALDLLCPVANEFLLLPDEDPSEFTDLDSGITAYNSINGCLA
ncbi:activating transcription factor 3 [Anopheles cruzii]|uniref:activating transcription factor 3 n=1 Tax=Anopheles cruzii TaxID=68878 RepID=UPI0022EC18F6|nr:activating transcription factor 3 [Anopheles cruzii]